MTKKKSAIPNASDMRNLVRKETKKIMGALRGDPDTPDKSSGVMRREAPKKVKDPKAVKSARASLEGKTPARKERSNYVGEAITVTGKVRKAKSKPKTEVKPKTKRKSLKESYAGKSEESMDPDKVESQVGTYSDKPIVNDTQEVVDPSEKQRLDQAEHTMKEAEKDSPNLWLGLAPLAMGAIMGDIGVGASVGGQALIDQGLRDYDSKQKRELASLKATNDGQPKKGTYQLKNVQRKDGTIGLMRVNTATGEMEDTDKIAGFKRSVTKDPVTGELASVSGSTVDDNYRRVNPQKGLTIKQQANQKKFRDTLMGDKQFQSYRKSNASSGQALTMLAAGNPIGDKAIMTIMPRIMGEVGNLTAAEQAAYSGSPMFSRKLEALQERFFTSGKFTEDDRADLMEVATVMQMHSKAKASELLEMYKESEQNIRGHDSSKAVDPFLKSSSVEPTNVIKKVKARNPRAGKEPLMYDKNPIRKGYIDVFELDAHGKYKFKETVKGK